MTGFGKMMLRTGLAALAMSLASSAQAAVLYDVVDLGTLGGSASAGNAINNAGQVVGYSFTTGDNYIDIHAFLYSGGVMSDLGTLGGSSSQGYAINNAGQVAGRSGTTGNVGAHAFLYSGGVMSDLGTLGGVESVGYGINNAGQVVGESLTTGNTAYHAFVSNGGGMSDLNLLIDPLAGWTLQGAFGVNDSGQITGFGAFGGQAHAFLLNPITVTGGVPEPASWAMMIIGFGLIGGAMRRKNAFAPDRGHLVAPERMEGFIDRA